MLYIQVIYDSQNENNTAGKRERMFKENWSRDSMEQY